MLRKPHPLTLIALFAVVFTLLVGALLSRADAADTAPDATPDAAPLMGVDYNGITFSYDARLAGMVTPGKVDAVLPAPDLAPTGATPAYTVFNFAAWTVSALPDAPWAMRPQVRVYNVSDLQAFDGGGAYGYDAQRDTLAALLADRPALDEYRTAQGQLPFLMTMLAGQMFQAHAAYLDFDGGSGVRYLTRYLQAPDVLLEGHVFYTYQGLTGDGRFYLVATFPVDTGILPDTFTPDDAWYVSTRLDTYVKQVTDTLNALDAGAFNPSLAALDALVASLRVNAE